MYGKNIVIRVYTLVQAGRKTSWDIEVKSALGYLLYNQTRRGVPLLIDSVYIAASGAKNRCFIFTLKSRIYCLNQNKMKTKQTGHQ